MPAGRDQTVLYRSFGPASNTDYFSALSRLLGVVSRWLDVPIELRGLDGAVFATKQFRVFHPRDTHAMLRDIYERDREGVGCVVIGNIQDPGLFEARQACAAPVIGLLESSLRTLAPFGTSVGLLASSARAMPLIRERIRQYGVHGDLVTVHACGPPLGTWAGAFVDDETRSIALGSIFEAADKAVAEGAELLVPASGIVATLLATAWGDKAAWRPRESLPPIVNPIFTAVAHGVMSMRLRAAGALISRDGTYASPARADLEELFYG